MGKKWQKYTPEQADFLKRTIPANSFQYVVEEFNKIFERKITLTQVRAYSKNHKLRNGRDTRFKPGHTPLNKGKKQTEYMSEEAIERTKATRFKKGQASINKKPVGSTRLSKDGYIEIKVEEPGKWDLLHRVLWIKTNGPLDPNEVIVFLDGNKTNCELSNLKKVTRQELVRFNQCKYKAEVPALTETYFNVIHLENEIRDKLKR